MEIKYGQPRLATSNYRELHRLRDCCSAEQTQGVKLTELLDSSQHNLSTSRHFQWTSQSLPVGKLEPCDLTFKDAEHPVLLLIYMGVEGTLQPRVSQHWYYMLCHFGHSELHSSEHEIWTSKAAMVRWSTILRTSSSWYRAYPTLKESEVTLLSRGKTSHTAVY